MNKWYLTADSRLLVNLSKVISMSKDEAEIFNQKENKNEIKYLITFTTRSELATVYIAPSKEIRDLEFVNMTKELVNVEEEI